MKLQSIVNLKQNGVLPFPRFRRRFWNKFAMWHPDVFITFDENNNFIEDDNKEGGGSRYWQAGYDDLIADDWEWFEEKAWYET